MKKILIILIGIFILSCNQNKNKKIESLKNGAELKTTNIDESFNWLIGDWKRLNNDIEKITFENWTKETNGRFLGHGFVMKGLDTIWEEKMVLGKNDSIWMLEVKTPGNNDIVKFELTKYDLNSFTVENPTHDFPKKIKYWKSKQRLNALVTGNENEIHYEFERIK